jgi:hypothetical protein
MVGATDHQTLDGWSHTGGWKAPGKTRFLRCPKTSSRADGVLGVQRGGKGSDALVEVEQQRRSLEARLKRGPCKKSNSALAARRCRDYESSSSERLSRTKCAPYMGLRATGWYHFFRRKTTLLPGCTPRLGKAVRY